MFSKDQVMGLLRHVLTTFGGLAVGKGWLDEQTLIGGVGAVMTLVGIVWSVRAPEKAKGSGMAGGSVGAVLLAASLVGGGVLLTGCGAKPADFVKVFESDRPLGEGLTLLAETDAARDALFIWNSLPLGQKTVEVEDSLIDAVNSTVLLVGSISPISATVYTNPVRNAAERLVGLDPMVIELIESNE